MSILLALSFLTIFPFTRNRQVEPPEMAASMAFFPLVGLWLGAILWGFDFEAGKYLNRTLISALEVAIIALLTGGLHLDGFSDTIDGMYGGRGDTTRTLEIMKDSRVGAMGVIGIAMLLIVKVVALSSLPTGVRGGALVLMPTISRWSQVQMAINARYARKEASLARPFVEYLEFKHFAVATVFAAGAVVIFGGTPGMIAFAASGLFTLAARVYFHKKIGGITGDTIGAVNELDEVIVLLVYCGFTGFKVLG